MGQPFEVGFAKTLVQIFHLKGCLLTGAAHHHAHHRHGSLHIGEVCMCFHTKNEFKRGASICQAANLERHQLSFSKSDFSTESRGSI
jgi:hypothetical protein